jgi:hypothetical protein
LNARSGILRLTNGAESCNRHETTRIFGNPDPSKGIEYEVQDRMVRKPCGTFYLIKGPGKPGQPEVVTPYSLQAVYDWLQDLPEQIERGVIVGGR